MTALDTVSLKVVKTIPVGTRPRGIVVTPDDAFVLVCNGDSDDMSVIVGESLEVVRKLQPGSDPETLALSPDGAIVYVSNEDDSMVTMLDFKSGAVIALVGAQHYVGDDSNQNAKLPFYYRIDGRASDQITDRVQVFGSSTI